MKRQINGKIFKNKKYVKQIALFSLIFYSVSVFVSNIAYYAFDKNEIEFLPRINFGIDIVGGKQLTIGVETKNIVNDLNKNSYEFLTAFCKEKKFKCEIKNKDNNFLIFANEEVINAKTDKTDTKNLKKARKIFVGEMRGYLSAYNIDVLKNSPDNFVIEAVLTAKNIEKIITDTTDKAIAVLKNRIDGVGVKEIAVQRYGNDKIVVLVPRDVNIERIKGIINTTAKLNFHLMDKIHIFTKKPQKIMKNRILLPSYKTQEDGINLTYMVEDRPVLSGECISNVQPSIDGISNSINFRMNSAGAKKFAEITKNNIGRLLAIVLDDKVLMAPIINTPIVGGSGAITGHFSTQEVQDLSILLRSGSLPVKISIINEKLLSSIFDKNILSNAGIAIAVCFTLVALLMAIRYKVFGLIAFISLILNFIFTTTIISIFGFTLTMPGLAGLILMLGMAVDANILIYEKMKELKKQKIESSETIIKNSFSKALATILDANITTIIAGIALFGFGGSFIKGFSITLIFGIISSVFTAVNITKMIIETLFIRKKTINI